MLTDLTRLVQGFSVETTPGASKKINDYREFIAPGTIVYVTLLPGSGISETLTTCKLLADQEMVPAPHFAARQIPSRKVLEDSLNRFVGETGSTQVLAIAGGSPKPIGEFDNSMQLLETGLFDKVGITKIGVAGHPEGSPDIPQQEVESALQWKNEFSQRSDAEFYIVTQFCFDAQPIIRWIERISEMGNTLPVHLGVPGVATLGTLIKHATQCGIGASMQVLRKQARNATKLIRNTNPEKILIDIANHKINNPDFSITDIHVYPLGGLRKSAEWFRAVESNQVALDEKKGVISVTS